MIEKRTIFESLLEAQKKIETVTKDATANAGSFKYNYATLGQVIEAIKEPLNTVGITIIQPIEGDRVVTKLLHFDGTEISDHGTPIICSKPNDPQAQGSAISYARRYGLMSLLCLSAEDDDGAKAMPHASPTPVKQTITPQPNNLGSCPKCGSPLVAGTNPKVVAKCSTAKWDSVTKTASGCDYVKWASKPPQDVPDVVVDDIIKGMEEMPF